jgi:site-specific recombinase XerD
MFKYDCNQDMSKAPVVEDKDLEHAVKVARITGSQGVRNAALLYTLFGVALTPAEISKLTVHDYLQPDGTVKKRHLVRAEIAYNKQERPLYWANPKLVASIDEYLEWRVESQVGIGTPGGYRGLDPHSALFQNGRSGGAFKLTTYVKDGIQRESAMVLSALYRELFRQAGVAGQAMSGRRTFAVKMARQGRDPAVVKEILGLASLSATRKIMKGDPAQMAKIVAAVY